jgi:hypothetical protein
MTILKKIITIFLVSSLSWACSSGKKALEKGNFDEAVFTAINRLQKSPTNANAQQVLKEAYPAAIDYHLNKINSWEKSQEQFHWERVAEEYIKIHQLGDKMTNCSSCISLVGTPKRYYESLQASQNLAADERYTVGTNAFAAAPNNRQAAKDAFFNFSRAEQLVPNYKDAKTKTDQAYELACLNIVVEQVTVTSRAYQLSNEYFQEKINEFLKTNPKLNQFVRFYTVQEAKRQALPTDHIIRLQFDDFIVGQTYVNNNTETLTSKDSVKVGETTVNAKKVAVYNRVTAKYVQTQKTVSSRGLLDFQIIDYKTNQRVHQDKIQGEFVWKNEWASFNGDERALSSTQLNLCKNKELLPPAPQQLFIEFSKPIYDQVTRKIKKYYENY